MNFKFELKDISSQEICLCVRSAYGNYFSFFVELFKRIQLHVWGKASFHFSWCVNFHPFTVSQLLIIAENYKPKVDHNPCKKK